MRFLWPLQMLHHVTSPGSLGKDQCVPFVGQFNTGKGSRPLGGFQCAMAIVALHDLHHQLWTSAAPDLSRFSLQKY